jgi:hypothetical protein
MEQTHIPGTEPFQDPQITETIRKILEVRLAIEALKDERARLNEELIAQLKEHKLSNYVAFGLGKAVRLKTSKAHLTFSDYKPPTPPAEESP